MPAHTIQPRYVDQLARRTTKLGRTKHHCAPVANRRHHRLRKLANREFPSPPNVDKFISAGVPWHEDTTSTTSSESYRSKMLDDESRHHKPTAASPRTLGLVKTTNQRGEHVCIPRIKVVAGTIHMESRRDYWSRFPAPARIAMKQRGNNAPATQIRAYSGNRLATYAHGRSQLRFIAMTVTVTGLWLRNL